MIKVITTGFKEVDKKLKKLPAEITKGVEIALQNSAVILQQEVKDSIEGKRPPPELRSWKTGDFFRSIQEKKINRFAYMVFTDRPYAPFLEHGTIHISPRRHFENSKNRKKKEIIKLINSAVSKAIRKST
jgi:hypothetical protein